MKNNYIKEISDVINMICKNCGKEFPTTIVIDGLKRNLSKRKYCLECSPFKSKNKTIILNKKTIIQKKCKYCGKPLNSMRNTYCDAKCQHQFAYEKYIELWKKT